MRAWSVITLAALCSPPLRGDTVDIQVGGHEFIVLSDIPGAGTNSCLIRAGDAVRWTWAGNFHSVTANDNSFDSGVHNAGFVYTRTFDDAGLVGYYCIIHGVPNGGMYGRLDVDHPPTDIHLSVAAVTEHSPAGTSVGALTTSDADAGDTFTYLLLDDAGGRFEISGEHVTVANGALLDFNTAGSHTLRVRSTDRGGNGYSVERQFTIAVLPSQLDCNANGLSDSADIASGLSGDCDANGVPDACQADSDDDGTIDACDGCPSDRGKTAPGACGCGIAENDSDGDGTADCRDGCPNDPLKTAAGALGCGVSEVDGDADGVPDSVDRCAGQDDRLDSDGDGAADCVDACPQDALKTAPGACGCGQAETDTDVDGVADCVDNCRDVANGDQADEDGDGVGDACAIEADSAQRIAPTQGCGAFGVFGMQMFGVVLGFCATMRRRAGCRGPLR